MTDQPGNSTRGGGQILWLPAGVNRIEPHIIRHLRGSDKDMSKPTTVAIVLAVALGISAAGAQPAHADPVGPAPVPPPGAAFGPPRVGSPPVFANTHGPPILAASRSPVTPTRPRRAPACPDRCWETRLPPIRTSGPTTG
jgi:hypothetical protein